MGTPDSSQASSSNQSFVCYNRFSVNTMDSSKHVKLPNLVSRTKSSASRAAMFDCQNNLNLRMSSGSKRKYPNDSPTRRVQEKRWIASRFTNSHYSGQYSFDKLILVNRFSPINKHLGFFNKITHSEYKRYFYTIIIALVTRASQ